MEKKAPVIIARPWTESEASVIKSLLESYNIPCHYSSRIPQRIYPVSVEGLAEIRVYVPAALEHEAHRILDEHRRHSAGLRLVETDDLQEEEA